MEGVYCLLQPFPAALRGHLPFIQIGALALALAVDPRPFMAAELLYVEATRHISSTIYWSSSVMQAIQEISLSCSVWYPMTA